MDSSSEYWPPDSASSAATRPPENVKDPMEFLSRSWSAAALEVVKTLSPPTAPGRGGGAAAVLEDLAGEVEEEDVGMVAGNPFTFACSATSQLVMERIMSQSVSTKQRIKYILFLCHLALLFVLFLIRSKALFKYI